MTIQDDVRKTLSDPTPLYAVAGTADLALEKLRQVPALVEKLRSEAPGRIEAMRERAQATDPKEVQERASKRAKEAQARLTHALTDLDTDFKKFRENAQDVALQSVGRAAEYAVRARETYDELAERGQKAVKEWRGETAERLEVTTEVVRSEPASKPAPEAEPKAAEKPAAGKSAGEKPGAAKPSASRTGTAKPSTPRTSAAKKTTPRKTTAKKTTPKPKTDS